MFLSHAARLSGAEIGLLRFVQATRGTVDAWVLLAEEGALVDALREAGAQVEVLPLDEGTRGLRRGELGVGRRQARAAGTLGRYVAALRARLRAIDPDIVHTISLKSGIYGAAAARTARLPHVWHLHDHLVPEYLPPRAVAPMRGIVGMVPGGLLTPSRSVLRTVPRRRRGMPIDIMPFPVPTATEVAPIRDEVRTIGIVGRITPWKGQDVFLEAFARAFPRGDVQARIIGNALFGETDFEAHLHQRVRELGIGDRVEFRGFREDVMAEMRALDIVVHASVLPDPLPGTVLEAMTAGVPVVAADAGGTPEHLSDGVSGLLHRPGDPADLARALHRAAAPREERAAMAEAARASVRRYSPEAIVPRMLAFYERVAR